MVPWARSGYKPEVEYLCFNHYFVCNDLVPEYRLMPDEEKNECCNNFHFAQLFFLNNFCSRMNGLVTECHLQGWP